MADKKNAPGTGWNRSEGRNTTSTRESTEETSEMSMTDGTDSVQPSPTLAAWTAAADNTVWSMPDSATDPISAGFTRPAWCINGEPGEVLPVQTTSGDRVSRSEVAAVPLLAYRGKAFGNHVEFTTARVHLEHRHTHRDPTVQVERHWFGQREGAPQFGETDKILTLRPAEARQLGALLTAAADLAEDTRPVVAPAPAGALRDRIDQALSVTLNHADTEAGLWGADGVSEASDAELREARGRTRDSAAAVMTLVDEALVTPREWVIDLRDRVGSTLCAFLDRANDQFAAWEETETDPGPNAALMGRAATATREAAAATMELLDLVLDLRADQSVPVTAQGEAPHDPDDLVMAAEVMALLADPDVQRANARLAASETLLRAADDPGVQDALADLAVSSDHREGGDQ